MMRLNRKYISCLLLLFFVSTSQLLLAQEIRLGAETDFKVTDKIKSSLKVQQRYAEQHVNRTRSSLVQGKLSYKHNKHFSSALGLRYKKETQELFEAEQDFNDQFRITGDLKVKIPENVKGLSLYNRVRVQHSQSGEKNRVFIRNQFNAKYKYSKHLTTSMSYELVYSTQKDALSLGRFRTEVEHEIFKNTGISGFFMIDSPLGNKKFDHHYIIGSQLTYHFKNKKLWKKTFH